MYKKRGTNLFLNMISRTDMVRYFNLLRGSDRKLFIPIINDGTQNHYYFEQNTESPVAILRIFIDMDDMKEYIMRESSTSKLLPYDFNVLEADTITVYESSTEIAAAGKDLNGALRCIACTYINNDLVEFDMFWSNEDLYFN